MYINMIPIPIFLPSSNNKGGSGGNNKFYVYGILLFVVGISIIILTFLLDLLLGEKIIIDYGKMLVACLLWALIDIILLYISILYKDQTDKEIFRSIGTDLIRLCNLSIIGFVAVIGIMIYDIIAQQEVITQTTANIIMGSAIALNTLRYIICAKNKKNTKKMRKKK